MFTSRLKAVDVPTLILPLVLFYFNAFAGQFDDQCKVAGNTAKQSCESAVEAAKAADSASSSALGASAGQAINPNSGIQGSAIGAQQGRLSQAQSACQAAKQQCSSKCDQAKKQAQAAPDEMTQKPPHSDKDKIPGTKASFCEAPIDAMLGELGQAQSELGKDSKGTEQTKDASQGGGMPPMSPPKGGGDGKKDEQPNQQQQQQNQQQQQQNGSMNCNSEAGARYSDCNESFVSKCLGSMNQSGCETFGERYCGSASSGSSSNSSGLLRPSFATGNSSGLVIDKRGEGLGSNFCRKFSAHKFCQQSGRGSCPSCLSLAATNSPTCMAQPELCIAQNSPEQLERARSSCPSDPVFSDPTLTQKGDSKISAQSVKGSDAANTSGKDRLGKTSSLGGSSGSTGGGSGLSGSGAGGYNESATSSGAHGGISEGHGNAMDLGVSGSGGGGGSSSGGEDSIPPFRIQSAAPGGKKGDPKDSSGSAPMATDVARQQGPNLFSISTSAYQALCESRRLNCRN